MPIVVREREQLIEAARATADYNCQLCMLRPLKDECSLAWPVTHICRQIFHFAKANWRPKRQNNNGKMPGSVSWKLHQVGSCQLGLGSCQRDAKKRNSWGCSHRALIDFSCCYFKFSCLSTFYRLSNAWRFTEHAFTHTHTHTHVLWMLKIICISHISSWKYSRLGKWRVTSQNWDACQSQTKYMQNHNRSHALREKRGNFDMYVK